MLNFNNLKQHQAFYIAQLPLRVIKFSSVSSLDSLVLKTKGHENAKSKKIEQKDKYDLRF